MDAWCTLVCEENRPGNAQLKAGNYAEAVARCTASLKLDATGSYVYGNRSVAFLRMDDLTIGARRIFGGYVALPWNCASGTQTKHNQTATAWSQRSANPLPCVRTCVYVCVSSRASTGCISP